jgi:hypothetical protein
LENHNEFDIVISLEKRAGRFDREHMETFCCPGRNLILELTDDSAINYYNNIVTGFDKAKEKKT